MSSLRAALAPAARVLVEGVVLQRTAAWAEREEQLKAIAREHQARERAWYDGAQAVEPGTWTDLGGRLTVKIDGWVCPAVPRGQDPGPLNDDAREDCGLAVELRSPSPEGGKSSPPASWRPNTSEIYACRETPFAVQSLIDVEKNEEACIVGFRRGAASWLASSVTLSPSVSTFAVLTLPANTRYLRLAVRPDRVLLRVPPRP